MARQNVLIRLNGMFHTLPFPAQEKYVHESRLQRPHATAAGKTLYLYDGHQEEARLRGENPLIADCIVENFLNEEIKPQDKVVKVDFISLRQRLCVELSRLNSSAQEKLNGIMPILREEMTTPSVLHRFDEEISKNLSEIAGLYRKLELLTMPEAKVSATSGLVRFKSDITFALQFIRDIKREKPSLRQR